VDSAQLARRDAIAILKSCRRAIQADGRLIVVEYLIDEPNAGLEGKLMDLNMMVITSGVERTREEYAAIMQADFDLRASCPRAGRSP